MTSARELADRVHRRWLEENPFAATMYGIPGYDDLVPDESEEGRRAWRAEVGRFLDEADVIAGGELTPAEAVTLDCATEAAAEEREAIDLAGAEHTVTAMQYAGPAAFLAVAARTVLVDSAAAEAYLSRLRRSGAWLDQLGERLRTGARKGRLPVAPLAERAVTWAEGVLADPGASPVLAPRPPQGWQATAAWEEQRRAAAEEVVHPALARWVATVRELLPQARPSEQAGLAYLPGGGCGLRQGGPHLHHPAAVRRRTAPDRPGPHRGAGGPGRGTGRRRGTFRAGRGIRRPAGLRRGGCPR